MNYYTELIFALLQKAVNKREFNSEREKSLYEKGYLIGLLASLAKNDSYVHQALKNKLKK